MSPEHQEDEREPRPAYEPPTAEDVSADEPVASAAIAAS